MAATDLSVLRILFAPEFAAKEKEKKQKEQNNTKKRRKENTEQDDEHKNKRQAVDIDPDVKGKEPDTEKIEVDISDEDGNMEKMEDEE